MIDSRTKVGGDGATSMGCRVGPNPIRSAVFYPGQRNSERVLHFMLYIYQNKNLMDDSFFYMSKEF